MALEHVPKKAKVRPQARMPSSTPFTSRHSDLANANTMGDNGNLSRIID
jgi:hypothetical protein